MQRGEKIKPALLGGFIFLGILLILFFIYFAGKFSFILGGGYTLYLEYDFLDNLSSGAKVRVSGGPAIGYVDNVSFETGKIVVKILIDGKYKINRGADFNIYSTSLVGQKYINISGYNPKATEFYTNNEYIIGVTPIGFSRSIEFLGEGFKALLAQEGGDTVNKVKNTLKNISELIEGLNRVIHENEKDIRGSVHNLNQGLKGTAEVMTRLNTTLNNLENITKKLNSTVAAIDDSQVAAIVSNVAGITMELKNLSADINRLSYDKNSALSLLRDKEFRTRLENTIKNMESFSKSISENPSRLLFGK